MKKSIIFAFVILLTTVGWLGSGQINKVNAQNDETISVSENELSEINSNAIEESNLNIIKVETKNFKAEQIDQSIIIQGQTIYNKKIDVKSETTGNITNINFDRGDTVEINKKLLNISN